MSESTELNFEYTARLFLGRKAEHIAGQAHDARCRRTWLKKIFRIVMKRLDDFDTTISHKKALLGSAEACVAALNQNNAWALTYRVLWLLGQVLGLQSLRGAHCHTLVYWRDRPQYYTSIILEGGDPMQDYYDARNAEALRSQIASDLATKGYDKFHIALVLGTTEYRVKQLLKTATSGVSSDYGS